MEQEAPFKNHQQQQKHLCCMEVFHHKPTLTHTCTHTLQQLRLTSFSREGGAETNGANSCSEHWPMVEDTKVCVRRGSCASVCLSIQHPLSTLPCSFRPPHISFCPPWRQLEVASSEEDSALYVGRCLVVFGDWGGDQCFSNKTPSQYFSPPPPTQLWPANWTGPYWSPFTSGSKHSASC